MFENMYYDRQLQPISLEEFSRLIVQPDEKFVGVAKIGDVRVSTVWLGINHNIMGSRPVVFELMIFGGEHDEYQERFYSEEDAVKRHDEVVASIKAGTFSS